MFVVTKKCRLLEAMKYFSRLRDVTREPLYGGRKITGSLGNVTVRGEKNGKKQGGAQCPTVCLSM
jgi:hypothetical protein